MSETIVLDYEEFLDRVGGEDDFARELLSEFVSDLASDIEGLKSSVEGGNFEEIIRKAHTLKGSAANLSAKALSEAAKVVECAGRENDLESAKSGMPQIEAEAEKLKNWLASMN